MRCAEARSHTLLHIVQANAEQYPTRVVYREKARGIWHNITWSELFEMVTECAAGLHSLGFRPGDGVLILGDNNVRLYAGMLATALLRGHGMPAFPDASPDELMHIAGELPLRAVLVGDQEQADKAIDLRRKGGKTGTIFYDDPRGLHGYAERDMRSWSSLRQVGAAQLAADLGLVQGWLDALQEDDPAVLVHSSGTTGKPKGIVLSHRNMLSVGRACFEADVMTEGCELLAYLPMAWIGDLQITVVNAFLGKCVINVPESQETVMHDLRQVAPSFYLATPRSWENLLTSIQVAMEDAPPLKRWVYQFFVDIAIDQERRALSGAKPSFADRVLRWWGDQLVFGPIKDRYGLSRVTHAWTGGEAIGEDTFLFYRAMGLRLRQLYGQSELSAFATVQSAADVKLHTVGRPIRGVEIRISNEGEVLVRSPGVFSGYLNQPDATAQALKDGWLHTADAGHMEGDQLVIEGRFAEMVSTAAGVRYVPTSIENRLKFSAFIKDAAVFGAGRQYLTALVCIDFSAVGHWAQVNGVSYSSYADLAQHARVQELVARAIQHINAAQPEGLRIRRFVCLHKEFDPDDGEITRTRKLRRNFVEAMYASVIDALYQETSQVVMQAKVTYETGKVGMIERRLELKRV